ncbi:O-antigen ligase family protein, partial [Clostridium saudiense]|nr:O-antigen ligase family protein [Clostridium saudiense]
SEAPTRKVLSIIPNSISNLKNETDNENSTIDIERNDLSSSNGRIVLWKDGLRLSKYSPVFGFGDRNIPVKASELTPGSSLAKKTVHNGFIHMLLSGGIIALIIMCVIIISIAIKAIRIFFKGNRYNKDFYITNIISVIIGVLLVTSMFLTEIFYQNSFAATIFWICLGYSMYLNDCILSRDKK